MEPGQNTGVLPLQPRPRDWIAGSISGITFEVRRADGQWDDYLVEKEVQYGLYFDSYNCTAFATLNAIEMQEKFITGSESNYSDMFVGGTDGLMDIGNYMVAPPDAIRKYGLVLESEYPWPKTDKNFTRQNYQSMPPQPILDKGKLWLKKWDLRYEFIPSIALEMKTHLQHAPLNVISKVCAGWGNSDVVGGCGPGNGHEYTIYGYLDGKYWKAFDHYDKEKKKLAWDYSFAYVMKNLLTLKSDVVMTPQAQELLIKAEHKLVLATPTGRNGFVKNGKLYTIATERAGLAALACFREGIMSGITVPDGVLDEWPQQVF